MCATYYSQNGNGHNGYHAATATQDSDRQRVSLQAECVWLNGELVPFEEATVHILNPTLHYGPGANEGIRCYLTSRGPALFRPEAHLTRFLQAIQALGVQDLRYDLLQLRRAAHVVVQANNLSSCVVRPVLYFTGGMDLDLQGYEPNVALTAREWKAPRVDQGLRMMVSSPKRADSEKGRGRESLPGAGANPMLARSLARRAGFDEAILLDADGFVADCTAENLFIVHNGLVYTAPRSGVLESVARRTLVTLAQDLGFTLLEEPLSHERLYVADEIFVCDTMGEVSAVREIDFRSVGEGGAGPVTRALQELYFDTVRGRGRRSRGWLEYVMMEPLF